MTSEIYWMTLTILMTALFWVPYIINRLVEHRPLPALWNPQPDAGPKAQWAVRMMRAHENAVENLVIFAPLVLAVQLTGLNNEATANACVIYFFARLAHFLVFTFAIPLLRVVTFVIGVYAQVVLAVTLLGAV